MKDSIELKTAFILSRALFLIKDPKNWTKDAEARDENNKAVLTSDPRAVKYCLLGALTKSAHDLKIPRERKQARITIEKILVNEKPGYSQDISIFNDHEETTHEDVICVIQTAIQTAKMTIEDN